VAEFYNTCRGWNYAESEQLQDGPKSEKKENYSDFVKRNELCAAGARFILVYPQTTHSHTIHTSDGNPNPVTYIHLRFVNSHRQPVLYVYDIQIEPFFQRRGMGAKLMWLVMRIGWYFGMSKCMLTSFKENTAAQRLYKDKLGFVLDEISPDLHKEDDEEYGYEILSITRKQSVAMMDTYSCLNY